MRINFNINETRAFSGTIQTLPAGTYNVEIVKQEERPYQNSQGTRLVLTYSVLDGNFAGSLIQDSLNLGHSSEKARQFAQMRLKAIAVSCGKQTIYDTEELNGIPFAVRLKVSQDQNGKERNEVDDYSAIQSGTSSPVPAPAPVQTPAPAYQAQQPFWN